MLLLLSSLALGCSSLLVAIATIVGVIVAVVVIIIVTALIVFVIVNILIVDSGSVVCATTKSASTDIASRAIVGDLLVPIVCAVVSLRISRIVTVVPRQLILSLVVVSLALAIVVVCSLTPIVVVVVDALLIWFADLLGPLVYLLLKS